MITNGIGQIKSRRDFMPFGEDVASSVGSRSTNTEYAAGDDLRQKFTGYQKDGETGLDFAEARMYENRHGRFTTVDPLMSSANPLTPQSFNRFAYCMNSPFRFIDKNGEYPTDIHNALIKDAFPGFSDRQIEMIQWGSAQVDTSLGTGSWYQFGGGGSNPNMPSFGLTLDFPRTLRPGLAHEHAMTPPGKSKEEAIQMADQFISKNINNAIQLQNQIDLTGKLVALGALVEFGKAAHTMMDSFSPTHRFFQGYSIPMYGGGAGPPDLFGFTWEMWQHKQGESSIMPSERAGAITLMRINLLTGLGRNVFEQAVTDQADRDEIYARVNASRFPRTGDVPSSFSISLGLPTNPAEFSFITRRPVNWSLYRPASSQF